MYILCEFRIGYNRAVSAASARKNMLSAREHPEVVSECLRKELERGALIGPFRKNEVQGVILNRFGVIPKSNQVGKWRFDCGFVVPRGKEHQ